MKRKTVLAIESSAVWLLMLGFFLQPSGVDAAVTDLQISSIVAWTDTGIDVVAGQRLTIIASGWVIYGAEQEKIGNADGLSPITDGTVPGGSDQVLPGAIVLALIGKIGGTTDVGTGTPLPQSATGRTVGTVGTSYTAILTTSGRLFLGYNDLVSAFGDNSRSFSVRVITEDVQPVQGTIYTAVEVSWPSMANNLYVVQTTTDLVSGTWVDFSRLIFGTDSPLSIFDTTRVQPTRFYRVLSIADPQAVEARRAKSGSTLATSPNQAIRPKATRRPTAFLDD